MCFSAIRSERKSFLQRLPSLRHPGRSVISPQKVKQVMSASELTVGQIKAWIVRYSLIQQTYRLAGVLDHTGVEACLSKRLPATQVAIVGDKISCRWLLNRSFLSWRKFCLKLVGNCFGNLALNRKNIIQRPMIIFRPQMRVGSGID